MTLENNSRKRFGFPFSLVVFKASGKKTLIFFLATDDMG